MSMRRKSSALAVAAGLMLVSGGCARDVLAPQGKDESGATVHIVGPAPAGTSQQPLFIIDGVEVEAAAGGNYSSGGDVEATDTSGGTLASDEALAALRAKLAGGE